MLAVEAPIEISALEILFLWYSEHCSSWMIHAASFHRMYPALYHIRKFAMHFIIRNDENVWDECHLAIDYGIITRDKTKKWEVLLSPAMVTQGTAKINASQISRTYGSFSCYFWKLTCSLAHFFFPFYFSYPIYSFLAIDGNYTEWSEWSECSLTCDGGFQTRMRQCSSPPPQYGGKDCEELGPTNGTQECNTNPCRKFQYCFFCFKRFHLTPPPAKLV